MNYDTFSPNTPKHLKQDIKTLWELMAPPDRAQAASCVLHT